jgi:aminodeoxyfutalosine deaminase
MLLTAALALPMDGADPIHDAAVLLDDARIVAVGTRTEVAALPEAAGHERVDFGEAIVLPGLVNAHIHLEYTRLGPIPAPQPFFPWLRGLVAWSHEQTPAGWLASARDGARQSLRGGVTCLGEIVTRGQGAVALAEAGLHGVAYAEFLGAKHSEMPTRWERYAGLVGTTRAAVAGRDDPGLRLGLSPHTPYTVPGNAIGALAQRASAEQLPLAIHVAESANEVALFQAGTGPLADFLSAPEMRDDAGTPRAPYRAGGYGLTPAAYTAAQEVFAASAPVLFIHGVHLDRNDIDLLADQRAAVALCPRSNTLLECGGEAPVADLLEAGVTLGIGTDSLGSNFDLDLFNELRALADILLRQRAGATDEAALARRLLEVATAEGARALSLGDQLGALAPGKLADLAVLPLFPGARDEPFRAVLAHASAAAVRATIVNGRIAYAARDTATLLEAHD